MDKLFRGWRPDRSFSICSGCAAPVLLALAATAAHAQESASLPAAVPDVSDAFRKNVTLLGIPPATVAPDGMVFAAVSWTDRRAGVHPQDDASGAVGFGLGLGDGLVDLQFTANVTSFEDDFGDSGYFSVKASHRLDDGGIPTFVALGADFLGAWGDSEDRDAGFDASLTLFPVIALGGASYPLMITVGGGDSVSDYRTDPGMFAGIGIGLTENFGTSIAFNGDNYDLGGSFRFKALKNWGFTAAVGDVFDQDDQQRVILSVNWIAANVF
ncbi:hypothetical protein [Mangrovicoccus sp. HB161399]|uniref:hypothetical protein n=1 Tax=Mangrovicoccus sp. HB161399 TaxID=2720392 RepID=UPI0015518FC6|nr:hypothetical protein [Mangrovicoccus sp. HB161399]